MHPLQEKEKKPEPVKLGMVQTDLVEKRARELAAERMTESAKDLKGPKGWIKKIVVHNWFAEWKRNHHICPYPQKFSAMQ